ncbi:MAG TPA: UDP-N-acetyl-alpha-D-muramoyl-L-alanyl-L-glutamate epimerase [Oleiagrimonas sp.]|nr:UDP-N-acetyl-alpha-D-muramoyl-L-alanyl-L-glutamate epimerase [Oleiagrimonas sp.]
MALNDPRQAQAFRFVRANYADGVAELVYAFDDGPELVERITFPHAPALPPERAEAFAAALKWLHLAAGVSYYKAGVPARIEVDDGAPDAATAELLDTLYLHGLAEFAYRNKLDLRERIRFPRIELLQGGMSPGTVRPRIKAGAGSERSEAESKDPKSPASRLDLPQRTLIPIGGGKDSLVVIEAIKRSGGTGTVAWVGHSPLIAACAERTGLPTLNIGRELSPILFDYNRMGAWNGHIPVTAVNSAILVLAALLYGHDTIAFANERSASAATLEYEGQEVNHQWSKGLAFERAFADWLHTHVATDLDYCSLLRPFSELAVTAAFARLGNDYGDVFSSCNRNFRILGPKPADRWCGQCPKCHFVFLALAPFMPKPKLLAIFGRNLLDDEDQAAGFDALMEYHDHKPFECVGEGSEARAAMATLAARPEWAEDALVKRFRREILPQLNVAELALEPWLAPSAEHYVAPRLQKALDEIRHA